MLHKRREITVGSPRAHLVNVKVGWGICKHKTRSHCSVVKRQQRSVIEDLEFVLACVLGTWLEY